MQHSGRQCLIVQEFAQIIRCKLGVTKNLPEESPRDILPYMHWDGHNPPVFVFQPNVATPLPNNTKSNSLQDFDEILR